MEHLELSQEHWQSMGRHASEQAPQEACGLLAGKNGRVEKVLIVANQARSPSRFVMDPAEQVNAFNWIDAHGMELVGIFHSHPQGPEGMSATDITEAAYDVVHIIWSVQGGTWKGRAYRLAGGRPHEVKLDIMEAQ